MEREPVRLIPFAAGRRSKFLVLALAVLAAAALASQAGKLDRVVTSELADTLPADSDSVRALALAERFPSANASPAVVVFSRRGGLTRADRAVIRARVAAIRSADVPLALGPGRFQSAPGGDAAALVLPLRETGDDAETSRAVTRLRELAGSTGGRGDGLRVAVTGAPAFAADITEVFEGADMSLLIGAAGLVFVLLILIYRSPVFWVIPFFTVLLAESASRGAGYLLGSAGATITDPAAGIVSVLVFGAATDYALLLVARYREELRREVDTHRAMALALRGAAPSIVASGGTVVLGLLTLSLAEVRGTAAIGPLGAAGVAIAVAFSLTALPASLLIVGRRAFWPLVPRPGTAEDPHRRAVWRRIGDGIAVRPRRIWAGALLVLAVLASALTQLSTDLSSSEQFRVTVEAERGQALLSASFPGGSSDPAAVFVPADERDRAPAVGRALARAGGIVAEVGEPESAPPGVRIPVVLRDDPNSPEAIASISELRRVARAGAPGAIVGGSTAQEFDLRQSALRDNLVIPPLTLLVVFVVLAILLRAIVAPLLLLATVVASFAAALGAGVLFSELVVGVDSLDPSTPLIAFVFLVALGVDYNIFLVARAREERDGVGTREGMLRALAATGGVITSAGVVLAGTFVILGVLPLVVLAQLGFVVAFGVLLDALLVRTLLVPALFLDIGPSVWWPAAAGRRASGHHSGAAAGLAPEPEPARSPH
jgi:RND superfamily putative drug exporter